MSACPHLPNSRGSSWRSRLACAGSHYRGVASPTAQRLLQSTPQFPIPKLTARFGASPCFSPVTGHLRRRGLGQSAENRGDVWLRLSNHNCTWLLQKLYRPLLCMLVILIPFLKSCGNESIRPACCVTVEHNTQVQVPQILSYFPRFFCWLYKNCI